MFCVATRSALPLVLSTLWLLPLQQAGAQEIRRCETADGETLYTDKPCRDFDAVERVSREAAPATAAPQHACHRRLQDLTFALTAALDSRDPNRLASLYHWPGTGTQGGYAIMDRLDAIAQRPLVDIRALYPADNTAPAKTTTPTTATASDPAKPPSSADIMRSARPWRPSTAMPAPAMATANVDITAPDSKPQRPRIPYALQVEQTLANGSTPSRTVFGLRRHLDCWWLSL